MIPIEVVRGMLGSVELGRPAGVAEFELGRSPSRVEEQVYRVLALRQLAQAVVVTKTGWHALGAAVDVLHALSMLGLAAAGPRNLRRGALVQASIATALAIGEIRRI